MKRTEGVSTTDIVGRMLTFSTEHFTKDAAPTTGCAVGGYRFPSDAAQILEEGFGRQPRRLRVRCGFSGSSVTDSCTVEKKSSFLPTSRRIRQFSSNKNPQVRNGAF